jgi:hypothetical protein
MLSVAKKPFILSAIMLNVIMLSVMVLPPTPFVDTCGVSVCCIAEQLSWHQYHDLSVPFYLATLSTLSMFT